MSQRLTVEAILRRFLCSSYNQIDASLQIKFAMEALQEVGIPIPESAWPRLAWLITQHTQVDRQLAAVMQFLTEHSHIPAAWRPLLRQVRSFTSAKLEEWCAKNTQVK